MIAIKGMEMPNSCSECNLTTRKTWTYACSINLKDIDCTETKRSKDCPLIDISDVISNYKLYLQEKKMMLDNNIVDNNEERYIPIRARGNTIIGYLPLSFL